jgi:hypothetical protein
MWLEALDKLKNPMSSSEIEPATFCGPKDQLSLAIPAI